VPSMGFVLVYPAVKCHKYCMLCVVFVVLWNNMIVFGFVTFNSFNVCFSLSSSLPFCALFTPMYWLCSLYVTHYTKMKQITSIKITQNTITQRKHIICRIAVLLFDCYSAKEMCCVLSLFLQYTHVWVESHLSFKSII
jgi:hypothetical protein